MTYGDIFEEAGQALAYGGVGLVLLVLGYVLVDLLTPGKLNDLIFVDRNRNAGMLVASGLLGTGLIEATAILSAESDFDKGLFSAGLYGLAGLLMMGLSFLIIDVLTPGKLGDLVIDEDQWPAALVTSAAHLAVAGVVAAALT